MDSDPDIKYHFVNIRVDVMLGNNDLYDWLKDKPYYVANCIQVDGWHVYVVGIANVEDAIAFKLVWGGLHGC